MAVAQVYDPVAGATVDQQALYEYMSYLSEDCYCAGWMEGTEAACWEAVVNGGTRFGIGFITAEEAAELRRLSETAGGWWHWPENGRNPEFVSIEEWQRIYGRIWKRRS
jgi:hypothetical protein